MVNDRRSCIIEVARSDLFPVACTIPRDASREKERKGGGRGVCASWVRGKFQCDPRRGHAHNLEIGSSIRRKSSSGN